MAVGRSILGCAVALGLVSGTVESEAAIIISQYYEGALVATTPPSSSRWVELANTGSTAVNLASGNYRLSVFKDAAKREAWKTSGAPNGTLALTATIPAGETLRIYRTGSTGPIYAFGGGTYIDGGSNSSSIMSFDGDDSLVLWTGATYSFASVVDAFGTTSAFSAADIVYVRNDNVTSGTNGDFNPTSWTPTTEAAVAAAEPTDNARLGYHQVTLMPEPSTMTAITVLGMRLMRRRRRTR